MVELQPRLAAIEQEAKDLHVAINNEAESVRGNLWFDKLPDVG